MTSVVDVLFLFTIPLHSPHSERHERCAFMHDSILFQLSSSMNLVYVCSCVLLGLHYLASRGQHPPVFMSSSSKSAELSHMGRLQPLTVSPKTKRNSAGLLIMLQPWRLYPRTDSWRTAGIYEPRVTFGARERKQERCSCWERWDKLKTKGWGSFL